MLEEAERAYGACSGTESVMTGKPIDKGSPQARLTMRMIDAWFDEDFDKLESLIGQAGSDYGTVFRNLIVVLGGLIQSIAIHAGQTFDDVLPGILTQMAERTDTIAAANVARQALTAWSSGDDELVSSLGFDAQIKRAGPDEVLLHLLGMLGSVSRSWSKQAEFSIDEIRDGWAEALGTRD
jgi:hypothetical protein